MKKGIYNVTIHLNNTQLAEMTMEEMIYEIAKEIVSKYESEDLCDLEISASTQIVEEYDPQYEIDENDCTDDELNFDAA